MKQEFTTRQRDTGRPLVEFLAGRLNLSNKKAKALLDDRSVTVNGRRVWMARHNLKAGDQVVVITPDARETSRKLRVLYRDGDFVIINKPPILLTQGRHSAEEMIREQLDNKGLRAAHRLDRETSGCLIFARSDAAADIIRNVFRKRMIYKKYDAVVLGQLPKVQRTIKSEIDDHEAVTHYRVLRSNKDASHLRVRIETGRTHQIRRHMADIDHPVLGDKKYLLRKAKDPRLLELGRHMLHASELRFTNPNSERQVKVNAPLPRDFQVCLKSFKLS